MPKTKANLCQTNELTRPTSEVNTDEETPGERVGRVRLHLCVWKPTNSCICCGVVKSLRGGKLVVRGGFRATVAAAALLRLGTSGGAERCVEVEKRP